MKRPKDFYLHRYWRDLSDDEKERLDKEKEWEQPLWLDSPIRGDWRDWEDNYRKYEEILDREVRKQLREFIRRSKIIKDASASEHGVELYRTYHPLWLECQDWKKIPWKKLAKKWKSLLEKEGFKDLGQPVNPEDFHPLGISIFEKKWNERNYRNSFFLDFYVYKDELQLVIILGPFYNAKALKLDKMIPKAIKTVRQIISEIKKETDGGETGWQ
jgi:hypothetical protein